MLDDVYVGPTAEDPIYTKIRDDNPTRYINGSRAKNIMAADGCAIEGDVENSILFRGVKIAKGAKVRNCVLMQGTSVEAGASLEYVIIYNNVTITEYKELKGNERSRFMLRSTRKFNHLFCYIQREPPIHLFS